MTKREALRQTEQERALLSLGFTRDETNQLRRISMTLRPGDVPERVKTCSRITRAGFAFTEGTSANAHNQNEEEKTDEAE